MPRPKIASGVAFDPEVLNYLSTVCEEVQRDRSFVINAIVREFARQQQERPKGGQPERAILF